MLFLKQAGSAELTPLSVPFPPLLAPQCPLGPRAFPGLGAWGAGRAGSSHFIFIFPRNPGLPGISLTLHWLMGFRLCAHKAVVWTVNVEEVFWLLTYFLFQSSTERQASGPGGAGVALCVCVCVYMLSPYSHFQLFATL